MAGDAPGAPVPIKATEVRATAARAPPPPPSALTPRPAPLATPSAPAEMAAGNVDMVYRDACAHLLAPLNACRRRTLYLPWKCGAERHGARAIFFRRAALRPLRRVARCAARPPSACARSPPSTPLPRLQRTSSASTRSTSGASRRRRRPRSSWRASARGCFCLLGPGFKSDFFGRGSGHTGARRRRAAPRRRARRGEE
jgi:hypothetical protein